jgi:hypothetical protein
MAVAVIKDDGDVVDYADGEAFGLHDEDRGHLAVFGQKAPGSWSHAEVKST